MTIYMRENNFPTPIFSKFVNVTLFHLLISIHSEKNSTLPKIYISTNFTIYLIGLYFLLGHNRALMNTYFTRINISLCKGISIPFENIMNSYSFTLLMINLKNKIDSSYKFVISTLSIY